ncbi:unnamed protein product [Porites lobata]|uniref:Uncharacterized protein n=1 Tax=Porites lobata TaxID=104759 RepID=A0ABN8NF58_9CNID|nr:unnamed protein product [Porites lobata]
MARVPPNQPSKRRTKPSRPTSSSKKSGKSPGRFYSNSAKHSTPPAPESPPESHDDTEQHESTSSCSPSLSILSKSQSSSSTSRPQSNNPSPSSARNSYSSPSSSSPNSTQDNSSPTSIAPLVPGSPSLSILSRSQSSSSTRRPQSNNPSPSSARNNYSSSSSSSPNSAQDNSSPTSIAPLVPRVPGNDRSSANRLLEPLNLASALVEVPNSREEDLMTKLEALFESQKELFEKHAQRVTEQQQKGRENPPKNKRLPKELSANVREVYSSLTGVDGKELTWDFSQSFSDPINKTVNAAIVDGVRSTDSTTHIYTIKAAMRVHFRTKKRQQKIIDSNKKADVMKGQRKRSRKNLKKNKRAKALRDSTSISQSDKDKYCSCMSVESMSSEESLSEPESGRHDRNSSGLDEDVPNRKRLCVRPLLWRHRVEWFNGSVRP